MEFLLNAGLVALILAHEIIILHVKHWVAVDDALCQKQNSGLWDLGEISGTFASSHPLASWMWKGSQRLLTFYR